MVKSGPAWFSPLILKGYIAGCRSPNEMGVKKIKVQRGTHKIWEYKVVFTSENIIGSAIDYVCRILCNV